MEDPIANLINSYHDFNSAAIDELFEEPSPLEFMRYVARNRPFVVRSAASEWDAVKKWDAEYLQQAMLGENVKVAITPQGNADAVLEQEDGSLIFVKPYERFERFSDFLDYLKDNLQYSGKNNLARKVKYAQSQNDNLRGEYSNLFEDVPKDIAFARIALQKHADAINIWLGNERSTTALHKDCYENVYIEIQGEKHFVLLSPLEMPCVNEQTLPQARYVARSSSSQESDEHLLVEASEDEDVLPVPAWDPDEPTKRPTTYSCLAKPLRVTLRKGDLLYLPAMWYHKVSQTSGEEGFACAVNYWYDMEFSGSFWTNNSFIREVMNAEKQCTQVS